MPWCSRTCTPDHANGVQRLLSRIDVGTLYLPYGADDEDGLLEGILESAARHGTRWSTSAGAT